MKRHVFRRVIWGVIVLLSAAYLYYQLRPIPFDSSIWKDSAAEMFQTNTHRQRMIGDLIPLLDKTQPNEKELLNLLGEPYQIEKVGSEGPVQTYVYALGMRGYFSAELEYFYVSFDKAGRYERCHH